MKVSGPPLLVTGGAGFIGANLADRLATEGHHVIVYDALTRSGVEVNLAWLRQRHRERITPVIADVGNSAELARIVREVGAVFHLAAQVAVTTSLEDPSTDFATNLQGTVNLLEAVRRGPRSVPVIFASTNKVYGALDDVALERTGDCYRPVSAEIRSHGIGEGRFLEFHTPYGCSKGAADQYVLDYARSFGIPTAVLRMSCVYGPLQRGTEDQGWVAHFLIRALAKQPLTIYGDGRQVRDVLFIDDAIEAYLAAWRRMDAIHGTAFNLGGGPANAVSLLQVIREIGLLVDHPIEVRHGAWRAGDQRYYVSDTRNVRAALGLAAFRPWRHGLHTLWSWLREERAEAEVAL